MVTGNMEHIPQYLVGFTLLTGGQDRENLGSDEAEILAVSWVVIDSKLPKLVAVHDSLVQPEDLTKVNWELMKQNGIEQSDVEKAPRLVDVLGQFDVYSKQSLHDAENQPSFLLVVDDQLPLRQVLHPEAMRKEIFLSKAFSTFFDIRKEYRHVFNNNQDANTALVDAVDLTELCVPGLTRLESDSAIQKESKNLGAVIVKALLDAQEKGLEDGCFREPDRVKLQLEHGICSKEECIDSHLIVRARGLPWQSSDQDVAKFFVGLNIARGGVALCLSREGRRNGEALVRFENRQHRDMALRRHRHFMGNRYIEIYRATGEDFLDVAAGNNTEAQEFLTRGADCSVIVRMRGLPYDCIAQQILDFFSSGDSGCEVMDEENGVLFVNRADGRATGDAFVLFSSESDAQKALNKHKEIIGSRYIELFRSTTAEVQQVINKTMEPQRTGSTPLPAAGLIGAMPAGLAGTLPSLLPQQVVIGGTRRDCIRLRGLPYEAQVQHILEFLGDYSKHIIFQGVHMVYNAQGHPSGECFIQMDSEQAAIAAATERHNKYMQNAKKQRYIEVFQCSADDMNLVLTGPTNGPLLAGVNPLTHPRLPLSPGNTMVPGLHHNLASPALAHGNLVNMHLLQQVALQNQLPQRPFLAASSGQGLLPMVSTPQGPVVYWPYPSPPISPSNAYYAAAAQNQVAAALAAQHQTGPAIVLMRGLPLNTSTTDIINFFQGFTDVNAECIQIQRNANGTQTGDALITFSNRPEAERAVIEKNRLPLGSRPIELFLYSM